MELEHPILILEEGMDAPQRWTVQEQITTLGRWPDNHVVLPDRRVSRHHARIRHEGSLWVLEDLSSTNGTFLNGERIAESQALQDGDRIQIAPAFQLRFVDKVSTSPISGLSQSARLKLDADERQVYLGHRPVELSAAQYALLCFLVENAGRVVTRAEIAAAVWPESEAAGVSDQAIDALIRRLRERLAAVDPRRSYILTVRGYGFKFDNP